MQASAYTKYIGDLTVYFDAEGLVSSWEGYPIYLDSNIKQGNTVNHFQQKVLKFDKKKA